MNTEDRCPCGSDLAETACCEPIRKNGAGLGKTAQQLMRARYSSYVRHDAAFLLASWHPTTRPPTMTFGHDTEWLGLEVIDTEAGGALDTHGLVEFRARFQRAGEFFELHERSRFERVDGRWLYIDGD